MRPSPQLMLLAVLLAVLLLADPSEARSLKYRRGNGKIRRVARSPSPKVTVIKRTKSYQEVQMAASHWVCYSPGAGESVGRAYGHLNKYSAGYNGSGRRVQLQTCKLSISSAGSQSSFCRFMSAPDYESRPIARQRGVFFKSIPATKYYAKQVTNRWVKDAVQRTKDQLTKQLEGEKKSYGKQTFVLAPNKGGPSVLLPMAITPAEEAAAAAGAAAGEKAGAAAGAAAGEKAGGEAGKQAGAVAGAAAGAAAGETAGAAAGREAAAKA